MTLRAKIMGAAIAGLVLLLLVSWWLERKPEVTTEQAIAHEHTAVAEKQAARVETLYVTVRDSAIAGRGPLRKLRDSVITGPSDTVRVLRYVAKVDTLLRQDSTALARADTTIRALHVVIAAKDTELTLALKPRNRPRLQATIAALYDPLNGALSGSGGVSLRVFGGFALVARADQRPVVERPAVRVGVAYTF